MIAQLVEQQRLNGTRPRVHPNGFLQLNLTDKGDARLHIWHPELPAQKTYTGIHDHIFDMGSSVVKGRLWQVRQRFDLQHRGEPTDEIYMAQYVAKSQSTLGPTGVLVARLPEEPALVYAGQDYTQPAFTFHESRPETDVVVTLMTKAQTYKGNPRVLVPIGAEPDNSFQREDVDAEFLWRIIEESV